MTVTRVTKVAYKKLLSVYNYMFVKRLQCEFLFPVGERMAQSKSFFYQSTRHKLFFRNRIFCSRHFRIPNVGGKFSRPDNKGGLRSLNLI